MVVIVVVITFVVVLVLVVGVPVTVATRPALIIYCPTLILGSELVLITPICFVPGTDVTLQ